MHCNTTGQLQLSDHFAARLYMLSSAEGGREKPITTGFAELAYIATWTLASRIELGDRPMAMPGELIDRAELILRKPMVIREGQRFVIREKGRTIISGIITEVLGESGREIRGFNYLPTKRMVVESNLSVIRRKRTQRCNKPPAT